MPSLAGAVLQVTKSTFPSALQQVKAHIRDADYVAVTCRSTGGCSLPWHRVLPVDTPQTAYLKNRLAAETYELLHLAVCPFQLRDGKLVAFPYNFHLFPRDELNIGMPSYSFSCQVSSLTSMAREGFDFNTCIYDGISYLSRVQETKAKDRSTLPRIYGLLNSSSFSAVDRIFMDRIVSKVQHWKNVCKSPKTGEDALLSSLRKLILGSELFGTRPCLNIDICTTRQVQLVMQALSKSFDDTVPIVIPNRNGGPQLVRIVLTSSEEDKDILIKEIQREEEDHNLKIRGFREVLDFLSSSNKPVVAYDCLKDFAFIHSKFISPLPPTVAEFMCSLRMVFPNIIDVNYLLKEIGPLRKAKNLSSAVSYLRRQFFVPINMEISQDGVIPSKNHGHDVLRVTHVFAKLSKILNISPSIGLDVQNASSFENYSNVFSPHCGGFQEQDEDLQFCTDGARKVSTSNCIFLWGFRERTTGGSLKALLHGTHRAFSEDFELKMIDKSCAVVSFGKLEFARALLEDMESGESGALVDLMSDGLKATGYDAYKGICESGLWHSDLADSFEKYLADSKNEVLKNQEDPLDIYWFGESFDFNDLLVYKEVV